MSDDYLWDRSGPPDASIVGLEQLLAPFAHDRELRTPPRRRRARWIGLGVAIAAAASVAIGIAIARSGEPACGGGDGFAFRGEGGTVSCGGAELAAGVLPVGGSLDTGAHEAALAIANIGEAQLGAHTRVHLTRTDARQHQLSLDVGHLHARVDAPPRLFVVDTASTRVVDLGCEYTIDVDAAGAGAIDVQVGRVELAARSGAVVVAPSLTRTSILAGREPGLPLRTQASPALVAAAHAYERGEPDALAAVLAAADARDAITIVALASIDGAHRDAILARLAALAPPPRGVTIASALRTAADLTAWRDAILAAYFGT